MIETPEQVAERRARAIARAKGIEICDGAAYRHSTFGPLTQAVAASDAAAGMVLVQGWQDIASAPRDGSVFLIDAPDVTSEMTMATYEDGVLVSIWDGKPFARYVTKPRKWMPLPPPPAKDDCNG